MVFKHTALSESAFNADSNGVVCLKTTAIFRIPTDCCLLWQTKRKNGMEEDEFSVCSAPPTLCHSFWVFWSCSVFSGGGHCHHQGTEAYSVLCGFVPAANFKDQESGLPVCG